MQYKINNWLLGLLIVFLAGCTEPEPPVQEPPTLTASEATDVTRLSVTLTGNIKLSGSTTVKEYGLAYSTVSSMAEENTKRVRISYNSSQSTYEVKLTNLTPGTSYYYRFYATNGYTEVYSEKLTFTTKNIDKPMLDAVTLIAATESSAEVKCRIIDEGGSDIQEYGFAYKKVGTTEEKLVNASNKNDADVFSLVINDLEHSTKYEIRAFAKNTKEPGYSEVLEVSTSIPATPSVKIDTHTTDYKSLTVLAVLQNEEMASGITEVGFFWGKEQDDLENKGTKIIAELKDGKFSATITELDQNTVYFIKAYAVNKQTVTGYSEVISVVTARSVVPTLGELTLVTTGEESLVLKGSVTDKGGHDITALGYLIKTADAAEETGTELSLDRLNADGSFQFTVTGLKASTTYQIRSYATNLAGTGHSSYVSFTTSAPEMPVLKISTSDVDYKSITVSGVLQNTTIAGKITEVGFYYSKTATDPAVGGKQVIAKMQNNSFTATIPELEQNTTYYIKAYATNQTVTGYSEVITVKTHRNEKPIMGALTLVTASERALVIAGSITDKGGSEIKSLGYYYQLPNSSEEIKGEMTLDKLNTDGSFQFTIVDLQPASTYQVRAFAENEAGIGYSSYASVKTAEQASPAIMLTVLETKATSISVAAEVTDKGGTSATLSETGFVYSKTNTTPTLSDTKVVIAGVEMNYKAVIDGLEKGTTYYIRAYAKNETKTGYSAVKTVTTIRSEVPALETATVTNITENSATVTGKIIDAGNNSITAIGFRYKTSTGEEIQHPIALTGLKNDNSFTTTLTGLNPNTAYQVRAYAANGEGTGYGDYTNFTTTALVAPQLTVAADSVSVNFITLSAVIQSAGKENSVVSEVGFCWSKTNSVPTIADNPTNAILNGTSFAGKISGLKGETKYYVRAYAKNESTIGYSNVITLTTLVSNIPDIDDNTSPELE